MAESSPRANSSSPWRIPWIVLAVVAALVALAMVGGLLGTATSSSGGSSGVRVSGGGPPVQRDGSARCPSSGFDVAASRRPGARQVLVPAGASSVRLCRYGASKREGLLSSRMIRAQPTTTSLAGELNALPERHGVFACPADIGPRLIAVFRYPAGADNPVTIDLSGCNPVSNGHVNRPAMGRPVIGRIARLVPPPLGRAKTGQTTGGG